MSQFAISGVFQSTLPRRERPYDVRSYRLCYNISIHAPAKGATELALQKGLSDIISIHAPAKGATSDQRDIIVTVMISIHAPAKGAT